MREARAAGARFVARARGEGGLYCDDDACDGRCGRRRAPDVAPVSVGFEVDQLAETYCYATIRVQVRLPLDATQAQALDCNEVSRAVADALIELRVRCDGDRAETAERLRIHYSRRWTFTSEYEARAIPALADALAAGDDGAAEDAARWIAAPDDAMARALAELAAPKGGA